MSTFLTATEASKIIGVSRKTISNHINKGKISASKDSDGKFIIEKSEFYRVYPEHHPDYVLSNHEKQGEKNRGDGTQSRESYLEKEIELIKLKLTHEKQKNQIMSDQIEDMKASHNKFFAILEDRSQKTRKRILGIF
jgi:hypothetical protein